MNNAEAPAAAEYRRMAARCRDMATRTTKPGNLLRRAEAFEATATAIEQEPEASSSDGQSRASR
jgi:hypothetical protein